MRCLRTQVFSRKAKLEEQGYNVILIWECEWKEMMGADPEIISHIEEMREGLNSCKDPIDPRQALYGGRTEATCVYSKADLSKNESIRGVDFTSLYPAVMKQEKFPVGHPIVFGGSPGSFDYTPQRYFGIMHCKLIPPRRLFHPVLPNRFETDSGSKLIFFRSVELVRKICITPIFACIRPKKEVLLECGARPKFTKHKRWVTF